MTREYGQWCGLCKALELVGGRWTLMIVRELLTHPKRFTELEQGLPGIPTNILSSRLRELEEAGLVERRLAPRPSSSVVYALTAYGLELEGPIFSLGTWGSKTLGKPKAGDFISPSVLMNGLHVGFDPTASVGRDFNVEIHFGSDRLYVSVHNNKVMFPDQPIGPADLMLEAGPEVFAEILAGYSDIESTVASGRMSTSGSEGDTKYFADLFRLNKSSNAPVT